MERLVETCVLALMSPMLLCRCTLLELQDRMFDAHCMLGDMFLDSGEKLERFFNDVQNHFVMPIESFVANDSKECKILKRHLDEREEKYLKHLRKCVHNVNIVAFFLFLVHV